MDVPEAHVALCVSGAAHCIYDGNPGAAVPLERILRSRAKPSGAGTDTSELICGILVLRAAPLNPLLATLPAVLRVATQGPQVDPLLGQITDLLAAALAQPPRGSPFVTARLAEILFAEALRGHAQAQSAHRGWFRGLADPKVGKALALIHARPDTAWTVSALAEAVALSPSRFAARFRQSTGSSALAYTARWRMNVACRMLAEGSHSIATVAARVGYDSVPAFARAFKSLVGTPPGQWRVEAR